MSRAQVEEITKEAERRDRILGVRLSPQEDIDDRPWTAPPSRHRKDPPIVGPLPKTMEVVLGNECHHLSAQSFEQVARQAKARFVTGLSATVARKDGHHPIIFMPCGPVRYQTNAKIQAAAHPFEHRVPVQPTCFMPTRSPEADKRVEFQALYRELVGDDLCNDRICDDVVEAVNGGRSPLVPTERNDHLDRLAERIAGTVAHFVTLRAGMTMKRRRAVAVG